MTNARDQHTLSPCACRVPTIAILGFTLMYQPGTHRGHDRLPALRRTLPPFFAGVKDVTGRDQTIFLVIFILLAFCPAWISPQTVRSNP